MAFRLHPFFVLDGPAGGSGLMRRPAPPGALHDRAWRAADVLSSRPIPGAARG